jgi:hypothetical protein
MMREIIQEFEKAEYNQSLISLIQALETEKLIIQKGTSPNYERLLDITKEL